MPEASLSLNNLTKPVDRMAASGSEQDFLTLDSRLPKVQVGPVARKLRPDLTRNIAMPVHFPFYVWPWQFMLKVIETIAMICSMVGLNPTTDSVGELLGNARQCHKGCGPSRRGAWIGPPRNAPHQVDGGGHQDVLEMRFRQASVA